MDYLLTPEEIGRAIDAAEADKGLRGPNAHSTSWWIASHQAEKMIRLGWKSPAVWEQIRDASVFLAKEQVRQAREEALKEVGEWLERFRGKGRYMNALIDALKSGRMPGKE